MTWEKSDSTFVVADVVEWTETIWPPKRGKRKQKPWGKQKVIGQIIEIDTDYIKLTVLKSTLIENHLGTHLFAHKTGSTITKKRTTLLRGDAQRLHWSEEDVRNALIASTAC